MIKFFRKIRQNLLTENRIGKYLLYAIGEIILVIIGILFALQINTWNENNKTEKDINSSLLVMIDELNENLRFIESMKTNALVRKEGIQDLFDDTASIEDKTNILNIFGQSVSSNSFNKTFELLKDEKKLQLIKDKDLIAKISDFYDYKLLRIDNYCNWHKGFVSDNIDTYIIENIPSDDFLVDPVIVDELLQKVKFRNILTYQKILYITYIELGDEAIDEAESLKMTIENYLENYHD